MAKNITVNTPSCLNCDKYMDCKEHNRIQSMGDKILVATDKIKTKEKVTITVECNGYKKR